MKIHNLRGTFSLHKSPQSKIKCYCTVLKTILAYLDVIFMRSICIKFLVLFIASYGSRRHNIPSKCTMIVRLNIHQTTFEMKQGVSFIGKAWYAHIQGLRCHGFKGFDWTCQPETIWNASISRESGVPLERVQRVQLHPSIFRHIKLLQSFLKIFKVKMIWNSYKYVFPRL